MHRLIFEFLRPDGVERDLQRCLDVLTRREWTYCNNDAADRAIELLRDQNSPKDACRQRRPT
jgi:hypothetical protein